MKHFLHNLHRSMQRREAVAWIFGVRIGVTLSLIGWMLWFNPSDWPIAIGAVVSFGFVLWLRRRRIHLAQFEFWAAIWLPLVTGGWSSPWMIDSLLMLTSIRVRYAPRDRWLIAGALICLAPLLIMQSSSDVLGPVFLVTLVMPLIILGLPTPIAPPPVMTADSTTVEQLKMLQERFEQLDRGLALDDVQAHRLLRDGSRLVHSLLSRLAPDEAPLPSVINRMQALIEQWQTINGITVEFTPLVFPKILPPVVESIMLRGLEETLANISRHAYASHVKIDLGGDEELLLLTISDNGRGLQHGTIQLPGCHGLRALRYRLQEINGQLDVFEAVDGGVVVQLALPIPIYAL